jgi:hypothetical protein
MIKSIGDKKIGIKTKMVNTFLPFADFKKCAEVLDDKRLGKQRVEAKQIINIITDATGTKGWRRHPAVLMWYGYSQALKSYYNTMIDEWTRRGFVNHMPKYKVPSVVKVPWFIGNKSFHTSHQANLVRKNAPHYKGKFGAIPSKYIKYTYIWPTKLTEEQRRFLIDHSSRLVDIEQVSTLTKY